MSTYAVFGMTRHRALEKARKSVDKVEDNEVLPEAEWLARVEAEADKIMEGGNRIQLSEKFDAPSFAKQFLDLVKRLQPHRDLSIKAHCDSGEKNPKTGRPKMHWVDIDPDTGKPI